MQVRFDQEGCFIEKEGRIIARGRREGRMFILDSHEVKSAMFAKSTKTESDIELWHKRIGHINLNKLKVESSSDSRHSRRRRLKACAKHANSENNTDTRSRKSKSECSRACGREHMLLGNTLRGLRLAPMSRIREPFRWVGPCVLLRCSSNSLARQGIGASCIPKMRSCFDPTSR